jgi:hypothetical protein
MWHEVRETYKKYYLITAHTARRSAATNLILAGFEPLSIMIDNTLLYRFLNEGLDNYNIWHII